MDNYNKILIKIKSYDDLKNIPINLTANPTFIEALFFKFGNNEDFNPNTITNYLTPPLNTNDEFKIDLLDDLISLKYSQGFLHENHEESIISFFENHIKEILVEEINCVKLIKKYYSNDCLNDKNYLAAIKVNNEKLLYPDYSARKARNLFDILTDFTIKNTSFKNYTTILKLVEIIGWKIIKYLPDDFKKNDLVLEAILKKNIKAKKYISEEILTKSKLITTLINQKENIIPLEFETDEVKDDPNYVLKAIKYDGKLFKHASKRLKNDPKFILEAIQIDGCIFRFASQKLRNNPDFVLEAVRSTPNMSKYVPTKLKQNISIKIALKRWNQ